MIKLQDFAKQCGVTDRAIQKQLKKHEKALVGHFERQGPNGTWLDEYAQNYIRSRMTKKSVAVSDKETIDRIKELEDRIERKDILIEKLQQTRDEKQKLLDAAEKKLIESEQQMQQRIDDAVKAAEDKLAMELQAKFQVELQQEKERPLTWKERFLGRKNV